MEKHSKTSVFRRDVVVHGVAAGVPDRAVALERAGGHLTDLSANASFREFVRRVKEIALGAYAHQDLSFDEIGQELQPARGLSRQVQLNCLAFDQEHVLAEIALFDLLLPMSFKPMRNRYHAGSRKEY